MGALGLRSSPHDSTRETGLRPSMIISDSMRIDSDRFGLSSSHIAPHEIYPSSGATVNGHAT